jgi:hypothetical protein
MLLFSMVPSWEVGGRGYEPQKDFKMRAALSHSWPRVMGQNASHPSLLLSLLTGPPSLSNAAHPLSKAALPRCLV